MAAMTGQGVGTAPGPNRLTCPLFPVICSALQKHQSSKMGQRPSRDTAGRCREVKVTPDVRAEPRRSVACCTAERCNTSAGALRHFRIKKGVTAVSATPSSVHGVETHRAIPNQPWCRWPEASPIPGRPPLTSLRQAREHSEVGYYTLQEKIRKGFFTSPCRHRHGSRQEARKDGGQSPAGRNNRKKQDGAETRI